MAINLEDPFLDDSIINSPRGKRHAIQTLFRIRASTAPQVHFQLRAFPLVPENQYLATIGPQAQVVELAGCADGDEQHGVAVGDRQAWSV